MDKSNIVFIRIDNRLVHGQVGITWANSLAVDTIVVVDDDPYFDGFRKKLMESVATAANVGIRFYTIDDFVKKYQSVETKQKLFLVTKTPNEVRRLVEAGIDIKKVNVGNMHYERHKAPINRKVYVDEKDVEDFNYLIKQGIHLFYQDVPGSAVEKIEQLQFDELKRRR